MWQSAAAQVLRQCVKGLVWLQSVTAVVRLQWAVASFRPQRVAAYRVQ